MPSNNQEHTEHHFTFLPYLHITDCECVDLGFAKIWNFESYKDQRVETEEVKSALEKIAKCYKDIHPYGINQELFTSIPGIGVIDTDISSDIKPDELETQKQNDARLILFISCLGENNTSVRNCNTGHRMSSSENYSLSSFSINIGRNDLAEATGFVVPLWSGGIDINKNIYLRTKDIPRPIFRFEEELLNNLVEMRNKRPRLFRRLISAIEVFYESYYNSSKVSHNARILLQASAFEMLPNINTGKGRKGMKDFLQQHANYPEDRQVTYKSERGSSTMLETGTMREKWANRFFTLRNHISHRNLPRAIGIYTFTLKI